MKDIEEKIRVFKTKHKEGFIEREIQMNGIRYSTEQND
jgi:hypothetical protein